MKSQSNNIGNTLLIIVVMTGCIIFMANTWVSSEMEDTRKITAPANPLQTAQLSKPPRNNSRIQDESDMDFDAPKSENKFAAAPKKKRQKIIYEIPLDDVNLVQ